MARKSNIRRGLVIALLGLIMAVAGVMSATALGKTSNPTPTCPSGYNFNSQTGQCDAVPASCQQGQLCVLPTILINGDVVSAQDVETGNITILTYDKANGEPKKLVAQAEANGQCRNIGAGTDVPVYTNTGHRNGVRFEFRDTRPAKVCRIHGQWIKVGPKNCGNLIFFRSPQGPHVIQGTVIVVRSMVNVLLRLHAAVAVFAIDKCGSASASSTADTSVRLQSYMKSKGSIVSKWFARLKGVVTAKVLAQVTCQTPPTTTVTVPTTTTVVTTTPPPTTTTTPPTTTTQPKSNTDLCINIDGVQTVVPAGYRKDPPDVGVPGNCTYVGP